MLEQLLLKAKKYLGQNFLTDKNLVNFIVDQIYATHPHFILEIGPGQGALSKQFLKRSIPFQLVEIDKDLVNHLQQYFSTQQIVAQDILTWDWSSWWNQHNDLDRNHFTICSNLPYNRSVDILQNLVTLSRAKYFVLMFQQEVAFKLIKKNKINALHLLFANYCKIDLLKIISPSSFYPVPQVQSALLLFTRQENPLVDLSSFDHFSSFLKRIFFTKRKKLKNVLSLSLVEKFQDKRVEQLSEQEILSIYQQFANSRDL